MGPFTLRRLMVYVSLACVAMAVLRHLLRSGGSAEFTTLAMTVLVATNILAWFQRAQWQVFWIGFGLFGWAYLMISLSSSIDWALPTTWFLDDLHDRLYASQLAAAGFRDDFGPRPGLENASHFRRVGNAMFNLIVGLLGGIAARLLFPAKDREPGGTS